MSKLNQKQREFLTQELKRLKFQQPFMFMTVLGLSMMTATGLLFFILPGLFFGIFCFLACRAYNKQSELIRKYEFELME